MGKRLVKQYLFFISVTFHWESEARTENCCAGKTAIFIIVEYEFFIQFVNASWSLQLGDRKKPFLLFRINRQNTNSLFKHWPLPHSMPKQSQPPNNISKLKTFMFCTPGKKSLSAGDCGIIGKEIKTKRNSDARLKRFRTVRRELGAVFAYKTT